MTDHDEIRIPEDEAAVVEQLEAERDRELTDEEAALAIAQAKLIGDV